VDRCDQLDTIHCHILKTLTSNPSEQPYFILTTVPLRGFLWEEGFFILFLLFAGMKILRLIFFHISLICLMIMDEYRE
jgi:hypothetical protein